MKINIDAKSDETNKTAGIRAVIWNYEGIMMAGLTNNLVGVDSPLMAEACELQNSLQWLKSFPLRDATIELDAQLIVNAINNSEDMLSYFGIIIDDCKSLLSSLDKVKIMYIPRSANIVAYELAKIAGFMSGRVEWGCVPPSSLLHHLYVDSLN